MLSGQNGQGKTNFIEAIYAVCTLRTFRPGKLRDLRTHGAEEGAVTADVVRGDLLRNYHLQFSERGRKVRLDGKAVRPVANYFGDFNVILFAPEDLQIIRGTPGQRRKFVDRAAFGWDISFLEIVQRYERILKSRNSLLKQSEGMVSGAASEQLAIYDEQLSEAGVKLRSARAKLLGEIWSPLAENYRAIAGGEGEITVDYLNSRGRNEFSTKEITQEEFLGDLKNVRRLDLLRGFTNVGPHRDDICFHLDGHDASTFASQGQLRTLVLAWKIAELSLLKERHGDSPILLLDDVSSELDSSRNAYLFDFLSSSSSQCFITTTHEKHVLLSRDRVDFTVRGGTLTKKNLAS